MIVVSNSTPIIGLVKVRKLSILRKLFHEVIIPNEVYNEIVFKGKGKPGSDDVKKTKWICKKEVSDKESVEMLAKHIGRGEAEVLVLGKELNADWLIIDEDKARNSAFSAGFNVVGLVGILITAKKLNLVKEVKPILDRLMSKKFYIDNNVYNFGLKEAGKSNHS